MTSDLCIFFPTEEGRREYFHKSTGVPGVHDYAGCFSVAAGSVDRVNGWEAGLCDGLGIIHDPL